MQVMKHRGPPKLEKKFPQDLLFEQTMSYMYR